MSALARYYRNEGSNVGGYDRRSSHLTQELETEGIWIHYEDAPQEIPADFHDRENTLIIYTPAVPKEHKELNYFRDNDFEIIKRAEALGRISQDRWTMAIAGTHGKTSTTSMTAWFNHVIFGEGSAFMGGISKNFNSNLVWDNSNILAVEADEYDRSFLHLHPQVAVITAVDADHLDIYGGNKAIEEAFVQFGNQTKSRVIVKHGIDLPFDRKPLTYSLDNIQTDFHTKNIRKTEGGHYNFTFVTPFAEVDNCSLGVPGIINIENAIAAMSLVLQRRYDKGMETKVREAFISYKGVKRRFDFWINRPDRVYMDDYAHHPRELTAMLESVREMFPEKDITLIFQPHLYTRTRDFMEEFAVSLDMADRIVLLPIYPAREEPIEGITSEALLAKVKEPKFLCNKEDLTALLYNLHKEKPLDIVISAGAGDIDRLCEEISDCINRL